MPRSADIGLQVIPPRALPGARVAVTGTHLPLPTEGLPHVLVGASDARVRAHGRHRRLRSTRTRCAPRLLTPPEDPARHAHRPGDVVRQSDDPGAFDPGGGDQFVQGDDGAGADRVGGFAVRWANARGESALLACRIVVRSLPRMHAGLGVGTQLGLSVARILDEWLGQPPAARPSRSTARRRSCPRISPSACRRTRSAGSRARTAAAAPSRSRSSA